MGDPARPLLRTPPFPDVARRIAAASVPADLSPTPSADARELFRHIAAARIGGAFWAAPAPIVGASAIVAADTAREANAILALLAPAERRHPLVLLPRRARSRAIAGAHVVRGDVDPWSLVEAGLPVHAHPDSEIARLARVAGAPLFLYPPMPAADHVAAILRHLTGECRYRDPFTGEDADILVAIERLALWRRIIDANREVVVTAGIAWWKRAEIRRLLWAPRRLSTARSGNRALAVARTRGGAIAVWPSRISPKLVDDAAAAGVPLIRLEDGFVRSVGLGSNLFPPLSITVDKRGIHYDPSRPSDLEHILQTATFSADLIERAEALRAFIVRVGISKYGAEAETDLPARAAVPRLVLVPGQVEDDRSVLLGGGGLTSNLELLSRARACEPDAEIWFRPHPDVDAGHRQGRIADAEVLVHADRIVRGGGMARLLDRVDAVHVLTSLTGFEALLRGLDVTCHGTPFYAGWGLTTDIAQAPARRTRRLTLEELVAGVLILYPRYLDPVTMLPCPPETLLARLAVQQRPRPTVLTSLRRAQGRLMRTIGR